MDPVTQTLLGAATAQAATTGRLGRAAALVGALAGELADIDVLLEPLADPALPFELHRHFTHALAFVPVGAVVAAAPFMLWPRGRQEVGAVLLAAALGYASHGFIDTCTTYGTHWLWPFSETRLAWDIISIIDPILTLVLVAGVGMALFWRSARPALAALLIAAIYLGLGAWQHGRATGIQRELAEQRGHEIERGRVMPTLGNLVLWRSIYEQDGTLQVDAIRIPVAGPARVQPGDARRRFTIQDLPPDGPGAEELRNRFERFSRFADGYVARTGDEAGHVVRVGDMRYSLAAGGFEPIWGMRIDPGDVIEPLRWVGFGADRPVAVRAMFGEILRPGPSFVPVERATSGRAGSGREARDAVRVESADNAAADR
jgi:inner membrane protein